MILPACSSPATRCRQLLPDFRIQSMEQIAATLTQTTGQLTLLLGAVAAISLLVGGIGVMNIMLVSVLEEQGKSASAKHSAPANAISGFSSS